MLKIKNFTWMFGLSMLELSGQDRGLGTFMKFNEGQAYTCITVDAQNNIWAGTNKQGLYKLSQIAGLPIGNFNSTSVFAPPLINPVIQSLAADGLGNVWVGHAGSGGGSSAGGGLEQVDAASGSLIKHYSPDRNTKGLSYFERDGIATLNVKSITVDPNNTVWTAHKYHDLTSESVYIVTPGALSMKVANAARFVTFGGFEQRSSYPEWPFPAYTYKPPITASPQSRTCNAIGSNDKEVWISVYSYTAEDLSFIPSHIKVYDLNGTFKGVINYASIGVPSTVGVFNGIHLTDDGDAWVTMSAGSGFAVRTGGVWKQIKPGDLPCVFPSGTLINENAIWGNAHGNVYIGTDRGLLVYNGRGSVDSSSSYTWYRKSIHIDMVSDNITGGCSENDSIQWIATGSGIMRFVHGRYPTKHTLEHSVILNKKVPKVFGYKTCNNSIMDTLERALSNPINLTNKSYHFYIVETEICNQEGTNGKYCTGENIYKLIKDDITFAAVIPYDFPEDVMEPITLLRMNESDLTVIQNNVNGWPAPSPNDTKMETHGVIKTIKSVLPERLYMTQNILGKPNLFGTFTPREFVLDWQKKENLKYHKSCAGYKLYNAPNFWSGRLAFSTEILCDDDADVETTYDPIYTVADESNFSVTNYTAPGHMLHPGKITRRVVEDCGKVKVITVGVGFQFCGNNTFGKMLAYGNTVSGALLFKNVDFRLMKTFNSLK